MLKLIRSYLFLTLLLLAFILAPSLALAKSPVAAFLLKALDDAEAFLIDEAGSQLPTKGTWINEAEFRWSIDNDFGDKRSSTAYEMRIEPKPYGQRSAEQKILALRQEQLENTYEKALNSALYKRYRRLLDLIEKKNKARHFLHSVDLIQQEAQFYRDLSLGKDFQVRKLLEAELALEKATALASLNIRHLNFIQKKMGFPNGAFTALLGPGTMSWLTLSSEIKKIISRSPRLLESPDILTSRLELKVRRSLNNSKKTQEQFGIDLLTFQYKAGRRGNELAFTVGVNLPLGDPFKTSESFHDIKETQSKLVNRLISTEGLIEDQRVQFRSLAAKRDLLQDRIQKIKIRMKRPYAVNDPELLFLLKHLQINQERELSETKLQATSVYLDFLNLSGMLGKRPLRNWIQRGHPLLLGS